jgi:quercetin 2,3-dioxygenase
MKTLKGIPVLEGAGVRLHRIIGNYNINDFDPFLLLDDFSSDNYIDYIAGFPWHPHRGMETVTYIIQGAVEHQDSIGNKGIIKSGNVQWMTAGSGIIHQEMPMKSKILQGFQLWVNLPKKDKMMEPRYQEINEIPIVKEENSEIRVIAGKYDKILGPVKDIMADPTYLDIITKSKFNLTIKKNHTNFAYVFKGKGIINGTRIEAGTLIKLEDDLNIESKGMRFLFVSGKPLKEPIAWGGPIVMNTEEELEIAFREYHEGTFIK